MKCIYIYIWRILVIMSRWNTRNNLQIYAIHKGTPNPECQCQYKICKYLCMKYARIPVWNMPGFQFEICQDSSLKYTRIPVWNIPTFQYASVTRNQINSLWPSDIIWWQRSEWAYGTKPLPKPMLNCHQWGPMTFIQGQFHNRCFSHQSLTLVWKLLSNL